MKHCLQILQGARPLDGEPVDPTTVITINHPATTVNITPTYIVSTGNVEATAGFTLYPNGNMTASPSSGDDPVDITPPIDIARLVIISGKWSWWCISGPSILLRFEPSSC